MRKNKPDIEILKILFKQFTMKWTITSLAKETNMSRVGIWKVLKKLEERRLISLSSIGEGKTSIFSIGLNWENPILEKTLALILTEDALKNHRWLNNFRILENKFDFLILYGSIINFPREAKDIDILGVVSNKKNFISIEESMQKIQKTQIKKIHLENFTQTEFKEEIKKPNKIFIDAIKKGIVLFGQEKLIKFIKDISLK